MESLVCVTRDIGHHQLRGRITIGEGQALLRELGMRRAIYDAQFSESDRPAFTRDLKKILTQQGPQYWYGALIAFLSLLLGQDIYEIEKGGKIFMK